MLRICHPTQAINAVHIPFLDLATTGQASDNLDVGRNALNIVLTLSSLI